MNLGANSLLIAYADDLFLVIWDLLSSILEKKGDAMLKIIEEWAILNNMQIAIDKTSCINFEKPKNLKSQFSKVITRILKT